MWSARIIGVATSAGFDQSTGGMAGGNVNQSRPEELPWLTNHGSTHNQNKDKMLSSALVVIIWCRSIEVLRLSSMQRRRSTKNMKIKASFLSTQIDLNWNIRTQSVYTSTTGTSGTSSTYRLHAVHVLGLCML